MRYYYDHQTDVVSFTLSDSYVWGGMEELDGGAVTLYLDRRQRPFAVDVRGASRMIDTHGLELMRDAAITHDEISRRMSWSDTGRRIWSAVVRKTLLPRSAA